MIDDNRIPAEVIEAVSQLSAVGEVYLCDGAVHRDYIMEKVNYVQGVLNWLKYIAEKGEE